MLEKILAFLPVVIVVILVLVLLMVGYVKAPPDQAYIISGLKKDGKIDEPKLRDELAALVSRFPSLSGWISCIWAR